MKKRWTALLLALALAFALGAPVASADGDATDADATAAGDTAEAGAADAVAEDDGAAAAEATPDAEAAGGAESETADAPAETADADGTLSFANVRNRMYESCYPVLVLEENVKSLDELDYDVMYERLRLQLNEIASGQRMLLNYGLMDDATFRSTSQIYGSVREQFEAIKKGEMQEDNAGARRQLSHMQDQLYMAGELLYISIKALEAADAAASRAIAALDRTAREMQLRYELGQVSSMTVEQVKAGRAQAVSARRTLEMNKANALLQLKAMTGAELGGELTLSALPKVTAEQLEAMDLEADLERAREASYELFAAEKTLKDAKKQYNAAYGRYGVTNPQMYEFITAQHDWQAAQYTYENTAQGFELGFRTLFAQVKDCAQALDAARARLASKQKDHRVAQLKYEQGNLSKNALADAADEVSDARDGVTDAERDLFSAYRTYTWAVERGILN